MSISWVDLVITGITGLGQPSIQRDVAFLFFDGSSYYHCRIRQASVSCLFPPYLKQQILFLQRQSSCLPNRLCASTSFATAQTKPSSFIIYLALFKMFLDKNKSNQIEMNWEVDRKFMPTVLPASVLAWKFSVLFKTVSSFKKLFLRFLFIILHGVKLVHLENTKLIINAWFQIKSMPKHEKKEILRMLKLVQKAQKEITKESTEGEKTAPVLGKLIRLSSLGEPY